ncbi:unnamed protein product, partial [Mesorhabditis spiculigera]
MQDWQYMHTNSLEITIEMGCFKFPSNDMLPKLWSDHEYALLSFLEMAHIGVKGIVKDEYGKPVANATVSVENGKEMKTTSDGEYWRILAPGDHELTFSAYGLETEQMRLVINGTLLIKNITLAACGKNEDSKPIIRRGRGSVRIAIVGVNEKASKILRQMAADSCTDETYLADDLSLIIVPDGLNLQNKARIIHDEYPAAVLAVADGTLESVVYSAGEKVPKIFHKEALERSLNKWLGGGVKCAESNHPLLSSEVAKLLDDLQVPSAFQVGVGLGCDADAVQKQGAAVAGIAKMLEKILTRDAVSEFSIRPSVSPADHFSPNEAMQATSAAIPVLEDERGCSKRVDLPNLRMTQMGTGLPPYTLVMAIEKKTEALVYEMASSFCDSGAADVQNILKRSTLLFMPEIPHTQLSCHDYGIPSERDTIKQFSWDDSVEWRKTDTMLVQTGCCYENGGESKLWAENEPAIVGSLLARTRGMLVHTDARRGSIIDSVGKERELVKGSIFIPLANGRYVFRLKKDGEFWTDVSAEISDAIPFHIREIGARGGMNLALIAMFALVLLLICCFIVRGRFVGFFNRKGLFPGGRGRDGFERIPLYEQDDDDEDTVVDMHKW